MTRRELAHFLRGRREGLQPADVGLRADPHRRTPGLRREEVAALSAISPDYCARLEQARGPHPSTRVLDGLADALQLTAAERTHLFRLAGNGPAAPPGPARQVRPHVVELLNRMPGAGAVVTDASYDVLAFNGLAQAMIGDLDRRPNLAHRHFVDADTRESSGAEEFAHIAVARLRSSAARYPHDERLATLLAQLRSGSEDFARIWDTNPVRAPGHRRKTLTHPEIGPVRVNCDVLPLPEDDQQVVFITADPGTSGERALEHLRSTG